MNMSAVSASPIASNLDGVLALVSDEMKVVEARLAERMESPIGAIPQVGAHLLGAGGKRLRPLLAVLAARATGAPLDHAVAVGCAAELIHTATLYHDAVVDDGRGRRGGRAARTRRQPRRDRRGLLPRHRPQDRVADRLVRSRGRFRRSRAGAVAR